MKPRSIAIDRSSPTGGYAAAMASISEHPCQALTPMAAPYQSDTAEPGQGRVHARVIAHKLQPSRSAIRRSQSGRGVPWFVMSVSAGDTMRGLKGGDCTDDGP